MNNKRLNDLRLRQIDRRLDRLSRLAEVRDRPASGWVREIRTAIGMSSAQLAHRMTMSASAVTQLEQAESRGAISLQTLERAAAALDCTVVYALVPRTSLANMRKTQADRTATEHSKRVTQTMRLESQGVPAAERATQQHELAEDLLRSWSRRLWD